MEPESTRAEPARGASGFFVAGTDTGVGKTLIACALTRALAAAGLKVAVMKPVASGAQATANGLRNPDAVMLSRAANVDVPYELVNPYCFAPAISPHIAAAEAGTAIEPTRIRRCFAELRSRAECVVVEGAGGWMAPIGESLTMADVATALGLPVVLVVGLRLGCLNHAALTASAIRSAGLRLAAWLGNQLDPGFARPAENLRSLVGILGMEPLTGFPYTSETPPSLRLDPLAARRLLGLVPDPLTR
jgi:dethiobiotin synthetase